jgi:hypothetical protein
MRRKILLVICVMVFIILCNYLPSTSAKTFNVGKKVSESEEGNMGHRWYYFDSGCIVQTDSDCIDYAPLIFDGNLSTGIDHDFGKPGYSKQFQINFPYPLNVSKIIAKPIFNGSTSQYTIYLYYKNLHYMVAHNLMVEKTFKINGKLEGIYLELLHNQTNATDHIYFNDIIIEYTPDISNITNLENIQKQIFKINQDINSIYNDIIVLKNDIIDIKENIKNNMPLEYNDSALQDQVYNLIQEINSLKENLTRINNSIPSKYNDSSIKSNIFNVENENIFLNQQIENLTIKINNLTTELEKISSDIQNLQGMGGEKTNDSESYLYMNTLIFGVTIIVLLLIILKLSLTILKRKHHNLEGPRSDDILISKIKYDILTNKEIKNSRLYDDEYKKILENGFRKDEMSQETYNYIKTILEVSEKPQNLKNKIT